MNTIKYVDIGVYSPLNKLVLVAEVKRVFETDREWAEEYGQYLMESAPFNLAQYFLLALPDRFYLWKKVAHQNAAHFPEHPEFEFDPTELLTEYFDSTSYNYKELTSSSFEMLVGAWLNSVISKLAFDGFDDGAIPAEMEWLFESGLADALRGGQLVYEKAVAV